VLLASDTHRKPITPITAVLLPFVICLLTLRRKSLPIVISANACFLIFLERFPEAVTSAILSRGKLGTSNPALINSNSFCQKVNFAMALIIVPLLHVISIWGHSDRLSSLTKNDLDSDATLFTILSNSNNSQLSLLTSLHNLCGFGGPRVTSVLLSRVIRFVMAPSLFRIRVGISPLLNLSPGFLFELNAGALGSRFCCPHPNSLVHCCCALGYKNYVSDSFSYCLFPERRL
jgi:hypothetical protein